MSARHILFVETEGDTLQTLMRAIAASHDDWHIVRIAEADLEPVCTIHRRQNERDGGQRVDFFFTASRWEGQPEVKEADRSGGIMWAPLSALPEPLVPLIQKAVA